MEQGPTGPRGVQWGGHNETVSIFLVIMFTGASRLVYDWIEQLLLLYGDHGFSISEDITVHSGISYTGCLLVYKTKTKSLLKFYSCRSLQDHSCAIRPSIVTQFINISFLNSFLVLSVQKSFFYIYLKCKYHVCIEIETNLLNNSYFVPG